MDENGTYFDERLIRGQAAEALVLQALQEQLIPNKSCGYGPSVTEEKFNDIKRAQIKANKEQGDLWFVGMDDVLYRIDVKAGRWIAKDSIDNFTTDNSYYFLNAGTYTMSYVYLMIRFDEEMKAWIKSLPITTMTNQGKSIDGYTIDFDDITGKLIEKIVKFDPMHYHRILRDRLIVCSEMNPPIQSYIIREK